MPVMSESPRAWFPCTPENEAQADMELHRLGAKQVAPELGGGRLHAQDRRDPDLGLATGSARVT